MSENDAAHESQELAPKSVPVTQHDRTQQSLAEIQEQQHEEIELTVTLHGKQYDIPVSPEATLADLSAAMTSNFEIPERNLKFLVAPKIGLLKPPFGNSTLQLSSLVGKKITVLGSTAAEIASLDSTISASTARSHSNRRLGPVRAAKPARTRDWQRVKDDAAYTFHTLRPLPYLPDPQRSLRFLERLRDDPGIRAAMRAHKFSVGLLTEMNPAEHTTHESRTLGLNRNRGEVIELRLRTDAYDGYRDYKTIRKTLCHELSHNVWGDHDANFWKLTREIEKEVEKADWTRGGNRLTDEEFYNPHDGGFDEDSADHGGWSGGEFVLGSASPGAAQGDSQPLSRREILARAAEERMKKVKDLENKTAGNESGEGSSST